MRSRAGTPAPGSGSEVLGLPELRGKAEWTPALRPPQAPSSGSWRRPCVASELGSGPPLNSGQGQCPRTVAKGRPLSGPLPVTSPDAADMLYCFICFSSGRRTLPGLRWRFRLVGHLFPPPLLIFTALSLSFIESFFLAYFTLFVSLLPITFPRE